MARLALLGTWLLLTLSCTKSTEPNRPSPDGHSDSPSVAQGAERTADTDRERQPGVTAVFPPDPQQACPPGSEKFIVLAREPVGAAGDWQFMASAWEYVPTRPEIPITKRCEFTASHWAPNPLFWERPGLAPNLVRLQVNREGAPRGYDVNLYTVDYRTWRVRTVLQSVQVLPFGATDELVYLHTDRGLRLLDRESGVVLMPDKSFKLVRDFGDVWLVSYERSEERRAHLFDPERNRAIKELQMPESFQSGHCVLELSPDRKYLAIWGKVTPRSMSPQVYETMITVLNIGDGQTSQYPVKVLAMAGSGRPCIPINFRFWFTDDGRFRYYSALGLNDVEEVSVDPATGSMVRMVRKVIALPEPRDTKLERRYVPDYIEVPAGEADLDHHISNAFLIRKGITDKELPWPDTRVGFSLDGKRFFLKMNPSGTSRDFYYGDLEGDRLVQVASPPELRSATANIYCVITP